MMDAASAAAGHGGTFGPLGPRPAAPSPAVEPRTGRSRRASSGGCRSQPASELLGFGQRLEQIGITVLENRETLVRDDLYLAGIDDVGEGAPDLPAALARRPQGAARVLVAHNPEALSSVPPDVELTPCGHTHGG
jgi:hypothetical protein